MCSRAGDAPQIVDYATINAQCIVEQKYIRGAMMRSLLYIQVSVSGQALVFVVRHQGWSIIQRAGTLTYAAFFLAQLGATCIGVFGFGGYNVPRYDFSDCQFCGLSTGGKVRAVAAARDCLRRPSQPLPPLDDARGVATERLPLPLPLCAHRAAPAQVPFFNSGKVPRAQTESEFTASVIGCT